MCTNVCDLGLRILDLRFVANRMFLVEMLCFKRTIRISFSIPPGFYYDMTNMEGMMYWFRLG